MKYLFILCCLGIASLSQAQDTASYPSIIGTYYGKSPCADCPVIETELELMYGTDTSGEFSLRDKYVERKEVGRNLIARTKGEWIRIKDAKLGYMIVLNNDNTDKAMYYLLNKDGSLLPLDKELQKIDAPMDMTLRKK